MEILVLILSGVALTCAVVYTRRRSFGFEAQKPEDFDGTVPSFDIRQHLSGPLLCEGVIYGPTGRVVSRFKAKMEGTWSGNQGRIAEHFQYDSGATQDREWQLEVADEGQIRAKADDIVGVGEGQQAGCGVLMRYKLRLPKDAGGHVLEATDWMYLLRDTGSIINHSQFRKFGFKVAELVATIRPRDA